MSLCVIPTILSGGAGSRLWPVSRELHPKPFICLPDGQSLLQKTYLRAMKVATHNEILTVTNSELFFKTEDEYRKMQQSALHNSFILEPFGRNTAPAIALAALEVANSQGDDAIMLVLPADHLIANEEAFLQAVNQAITLASQGGLVTFGIKPNCPETGYGYIEAKGQTVLRFVEKPSLKKAEEYLDSGNFLWNSGMFCFTAKAVLQELETHCPELLSAVKTCFEESKKQKVPNTLKIDPATFDKVIDKSIDHAIFEKSKHVLVVPCDIGWSDIGSWNAISALTEPDEQGNCVRGEALLEDVKNCYVQSEHRLVGALGVEDLFIIDTPDALLVADKSRAQEVKNLYGKLKENNHETYKLHKTVHRPWGTYSVLEEGLNFKIKRIEVRPGASLSLQMHHHRSEHWIVVSGMAKVTNGEGTFFVSTNESTFIPAGHKHRLENPGVLNLVMIEVQSGAYLGEDDIVRFEDNYGRK